MLVVHNSFESQNYDEAKVRDEWERSTKAKYDARMRNNTWVLEELPPSFKVSISLDANGFTKQYNAMVCQRNIRQRWLQKVFLNKREWIIKKHLLQSQSGHN